MTRPWRYACASVEGTAHARVGTACQDAAVCTLVKDSAGAEVLVGVAADGAGSASRGGEGAGLSCARMLDVVSLFLARSTAPEITPELLRAWFREIRDGLATTAAASGTPLADYACTLLLAVAGPHNAWFSQVGDGAIVIGHPGDDFDWVFWPQQGEYVNTTCFVTDEEAFQHLECQVREGVDELALLTDGVQRLALDFRQRKVHQPFFHDLFARLRTVDGAATDELSRGLGAFLTSPRVNARTDDDKTLILATRRAP
ncbi:MAG: PP2C family serine/threonine-protein phosphatase [Candidatus Xenobia bacterium]